MKQRTDYAKIIEKRLKETGKSRYWLSQQLQMHNQTLYYKFKNNSFRIEELEEIAEILDMEKDWDKK